MDIEYFRTVVDAMSGFGDSAIVLAVFWIFANDVLPVIAWIVALVIIALVS